MLLLWILVWAWHWDVVVLAAQDLPSAQTPHCSRLLGRKHDCFVQARTGCKAHLKSNPCSKEDRHCLVKYSESDGQCCVHSYCESGRSHDGLQFIVDHANNRIDLEIIQDDARSRKADDDNLIQHEATTSEEIEAGNKFGSERQQDVQVPGKSITDDDVTRRVRRSEAVQQPSVADVPEMASTAERVIEAKNDIAETVVAADDAIREQFPKGISSAPDDGGSGSSVVATYIGSDSFESVKEGEATGESISHFHTDEDDSSHELWASASRVQASRYPGGEDEILPPDWLKIPGECFPLSGSCERTALERCEKRNSMYCAAEGECSVDDERSTFEDTRCCYKLSCPKSSVTPDGCLPASERCKRSPDCMRHKLRHCANGGHCVHLRRRRHDNVGECCYKAICNDEARPIGPGVTMVKVSSPAQCNRSVCPSLPGVCWPREGSCLVRSMCEGRGRCRCRVDVRCFDRDRHVFDIEYELPREEVTATPAVESTTSLADKSKIDINIGGDGSHIKLSNALSNMSIEVEQLPAEQDDYSLGQVTLDRHVTEPDEEESEEETNLALGLTLESSWKETESEEDYTAEDETLEDLLVNRMGAVFPGATEDDKATIPDSTATTARSSITTTSFLPTRRPFQPKKLSQKRVSKEFSTEEEMQSWSYEYDYFKPTETWKPATHRTFERVTFTKNAKPESTTRAGEDTAAGLFKQRCVETTESVLPQEIPEFHLRKINYDLRTRGRTSSFTVSNITECSDRLCAYIGSGVCPAGDGGSCRAFGRCTRTRCRCYLDADCPKGARRPLQEVQQVSAAELTVALRANHTADFISTSVADCGDHLCKSVGKVCTASGVCRTLRRCFAAECTCVIDVQCFDESGQPELLTPDDSEHPDLDEARRLVERTGGVRTVLSLSLTRLFHCSSVVVCPHFQNLCQYQSQTCLAQPTCDQSLPMCIVDLCGPQPPAPDGKDHELVNRVSFRLVSEDTSVTIIVASREECEKEICSMLAEESIQCGRSRYCRSRGDCSVHASSSSCLCEIHRACLKGNLLKYNMSHLLVPPHKAFQVVDVEDISGGTTDGSEDDHFEGEKLSSAGRGSKTVEMEMITRKLRGGGNTTLKVGTVDDCREDDICPRLHDDVCPQVGTCWTQVTCRGNIHCSCIISVACHLHIGESNHVSKRYEMARVAVDTETLHHDLGDTGGQIDVVAHRRSDCRRLYCEEMDYSCLRMAKNAERAGECNAALTCVEDKCLCAIDVTCPKKRAAAGDYYGEYFAQSTHVNNISRSWTTKPAPSSTTPTTTTTPSQLIVFAKEVSVKFVVKGLVRSNLQTGMVCSESQLCGRMQGICQPNDAPPNSCRVVPVCSQDECECNMKTVCPDVSEISGPSTVAPTLNDRDYTGDNLQQGNEGEHSHSRSQRLPSFHLKRFVSRLDLSLDGIQKCLASCYRHGGGCVDKKSCQLRVQCFHDHCVCHMSLECALLDPVEDVKPASDIYERVHCSEKSLLTACADVNASCRGQRALCRVSHACPFGGEHSCVCFRVLSCDRTSQPLAEFISLATQTRSFQPLAEVFNSDGRSRCNLLGLRKEKLLPWYSNHCNNKEDFSCYADHEFRVESNLVHCNVRCGCLKDVKVQLHPRDFACVETKRS